MEGRRLTGAGTEASPAWAPWQWQPHRGWLSLQLSVSILSGLCAPTARDNRVMKCPQSVRWLHTQARGCFPSFFFPLCPLMSVEVFAIDMRGLAPAVFGSVGDIATALGELASPREDRFELQQ